MVGGKRQPEADGRKHFSGVYLRTLARLFAEDRPKAEGSLEPHFFGSSQRAAWRGLVVGGKRQPEADGRKHFSGVYLRTLARLFAEDRPKAEGSLEPHFFGSSQRVA